MTTTDRCLEWAVVAGCWVLALVVCCGIGWCLAAIDHVVRRRKGRG